MPAEARRPFFRSPYVWLAIAGIVTLTALRALFPPPERPPFLGRVEEFRLVDERGQPYGTAELKDHVWIANTFFTRCGSICPKLMSDVKVVSERLLRARAIGVRLVSITVDPDYDTPEILAAYAGARSVDRERWALLTGSRPQVHRLVDEGLHLVMGEPEADEAGLIDVAHSGKIAVVDGGGCVRGYFDPDPTGLDGAYRTALLVRADPCNPLIEWPAPEEK